MDDLGLPVTREVIQVAPVVMGSKRGGVLQTILGDVLVAVEAVMTYMSGGTASPIAAGLMTNGIRMMAGGVIQMLFPQPAGLTSK